MDAKRMADDIYGEDGKANLASSNEMGTTEKKRENQKNFVLLEDDNIPRTQWKLARVKEIIEGRESRLETN